MKILVIKPSSLGDVIHALPFLRAVKDRYHDSQIDWVISKNLREILDGNPLINRLIVMDKDSWKKIKKLPETLSDLSALKKALQTTRYDFIVDLQGLLRSGLITYFSKGTVKVGFEDAREGSQRFYDKKISVKNITHAVDKCIEAAKAIGAETEVPEFPLYIDGASREKARELVRDINEYIVIVPAARWLTKRWPVEKYASLLMKLPLPAVIIGSKGDAGLADQIIGLRGETEDRIINLCGKTGLKELAAVLAGARLVITNDSGPMHIAAALDLPLVAIFGPTDPGKTGPYGWRNNDKFKVVQAVVPCRPCRKKKCNHFICMQGINVEDVSRAATDLLKIC